jgi:hypothetical protein
VNLGGNTRSGTPACCSSTRVPLPHRARAGYCSRLLLVVLVVVARRPTEARPQLLGHDLDPPGGLGGGREPLAAAHPPYFGRRPLGTISAQVVQRWQNELERRASHNLTMACRSILSRILEAAEAERLIPVNPVRKVRAPRRPVDPEVVFGRVRRRTYTPEEFGRLLVACPAFYRDHFIVQVAPACAAGSCSACGHGASTWPPGGSRSWTCATTPAGSGSGYKDRPKSDASIRAVPMAAPVAAAMARRLNGCGRDELVFCGPGGSNGIPGVTVADRHIPLVTAAYGTRVARPR